MKQTLTVLSIAGSDNGAGAGLQADLKTFSAIGVYGSTTVTCVTAQNTQGVFMNQAMPVELIKKQLDVALEDFKVKFIKIGMLPNQAIINLLIAYFKKRPQYQLIFDPVLVCKQGYDLTQMTDHITQMKTLMKYAYVITPNLQEAEILSDIKINNNDDMVKAALALKKLGPLNVVIKGGHSQDNADDLLLTADNKVHWFKGKRLESNFTHGAGCTLSSAIAAYLTKGFALTEAVASAKNFVTQAMQTGIKIGAGINPLNHFNFSFIEE